MVSWGIVTICTAAVTTYEGLIICRVFLGVAEAGFFVCPTPYTLHPLMVSPVSSATFASGKLSDGETGQRTELQVQAR